MSEKLRLDILLTQRDLAPSREAARRLIMAGEVRVDGEIRDKPGMKVSADAAVEVQQAPRFVSRGGDKLQGAFAAFSLSVEGDICADVGASTGGFTDCLLQHGAAKVYAIDVGYGQLDYRLRSDERVVVMERTNARYLDSLPEPVAWIVADTSFISLRYLFPVFRGWLTETGQMVVLVKPQFEAGKEYVGKGGVVSDPDTHYRVLVEVLAAAQREGYTVRGLASSPLKGPSGNVEFLAWLGVGEPDAASTPLDDLILPTMAAIHPGWSPSEADSV